MKKTVSGVWSVFAVQAKHATFSNKCILDSGDDFLIVALAISLSKDDPFFHAQQDRYLMGFPTPSFFTPSEHLIGGGRIYTVLTGERLH